MAAELQNDPDAVPGQLGDELLVGVEGPGVASAGDPGEVHAGLVEQVHRCLTGLGADVAADQDAVPLGRGRRRTEGGECQREHDGEREQ